MSEESDWIGRMFDLFHDTYFEYSGLKISFRPIGGGHDSSTAVLIRNEDEKGMCVRFDWYNIPDRRKRKIYHIKSGQKKRFVVPPQRRVSILWKST